MILPDAPPWVDEDIPFPDDEAETLVPSQLSGVEVLRAVVAEIEACKVPVEEKAARKKAVSEPIISLYGDSARWSAVVAAHRDYPVQVEGLLGRLEVLTSGTVAATMRRQLRVSVATSKPLRVAGSDEELTVREAVGWEGYPADLVVPHGWRLTPHLLVQERQTESGLQRWELGLPMLVTRRLADVETGDHSVELAWQEEGRWRLEVVPRSSALDTRSLVKLSDRGMPVSSQTARGYVSWLSALDAQIGTIDHGTARMGWCGRGTSYYLLGRRLLYRGEEPEHRIDLIQGSAGGRQLCDAIHQGGSWEGWCDLTRLVETFPAPWLAIYAACSAPLLRVLGAPSWGVDFAGPSSGGKSTVLELATSTYALPEKGEGYRSWGGSLPGTEAYVATLCDMPACLDEGQLVPASERARAGTLLHAMVDGAGRLRGTTARLGAMLTEHWRTALISTSEDGITSWAPHDGIQARVIVVHGRPLGSEGKDLSEELQILYREHYGHLLPRVVQWLVDQPRSGRDQLKAIWRRRSQEIGATARNSMAGRAARIAATIEGAAFIVHEILGVPRPTVDVQKWIWEQIQTSCGGEDRATRCLDAVWTWIAGHPDEIEGASSKTGPRGWSGVHRREGIGLTPACVREILAGEGQSNPGPLIRQWIERGEVHAGGDGKSSTLMRMGGIQTRLIFFVRRAEET